MRTRIGLLLVLLLTAGCVRQPGPQLQALIDRQAIDQLVAGDYPHALDSRDWDAYVAHFAQDGELTLGPQTARGHAEIKALLEGLPPERINHVISNLSYEIDGDTATGGSYWQDIGLVNGAPGVAVAGHYEDTLRKIDGEWKFAKRAIVIDFPAPASEAADAVDTADTADAADTADTADAADTADKADKAE
jgi:ketosteroid isomerase-like protein